MPNLNEITPMPHTNEEMREEFKKQLFCGTEEFTDEVADFWLNKISNLKKTIREEIELKKQTMKDTHLCRFNDGEQNCDCYLETLDEILSLKSLE